MMIIDIHTHIFSREIIQNRDKYCAADACFELLYSQEKAKLLCAEDLINSMDEKGISKSVVLNIGWNTHEMCVRTNGYILEAISKYPTRLIGFCSLQPLEREKAIREIDRCFTAGAQGIGELRPDIQGYDLCDDGLVTPLVELMVKNNAVLLLHASEPVGHAYPGKGTLTPFRLYSFIQRFQKLKIILAHFGGGLAFYELMPEVAAVLHNTYYDTAAAPFLYQPGIYSPLIQIIGNNKLLFGSDWPLLDQKRVLDHIKSGRLSDLDVHNVLYANAAGLFDE